MKAIYLTQFDLSGIWVESEGEGVDPAQGYPSRSEASRLEVSILKDPRTRKFGLIHDFLSLTTFAAGAGLANARGISFLKEHCRDLGVGDVKALPEKLSGYCSFTIDRIVSGAIDMKRSEILIEPHGMWRAVSKLVLARDIDGEGFFRFGERPHNFFCTEEVVRDYREAGLTGLKFGEVAPVRRVSVHWYDPMP